MHENNGHKVFSLLVLEYLHVQATSYILFEVFRVEVKKSSIIFWCLFTGGQI